MSARSKPAGADALAGPTHTPAAPARAHADAAPGRVPARPKPGPGAAGSLAFQLATRVGPVDDPLELEAERAASAAVAQGRDPDEPELPAAASAPLVQRAPAAAVAAASPAPGAAGPADATAPAGAAAPAGLDAMLTGLHGRGAPLDSQVRGDLEQGLGADFSSVRVHTGTAAAAATRTLDAIAFAHRDHIAFAPGQYAPEAPAGRHLLAHELAHVVQQGAVPRAPGGSSAVQRRTAHPTVQRQVGLPRRDLPIAPRAVAPDPTMSEWELADAATCAARIKDAFHERWDEDEEAALAQIRGKLPEMITAIIAAYRTISPGRGLVGEFQAYLSTAEFAEAMRWLGPALSLTDRISHAGRNATLILDLIDHASPLEREIAFDDAALQHYLPMVLTPGERFKARKQLIVDIRPEQLYLLVQTRIQDAAQGVFDDDEGAMAMALLDLSHADRMRYWKEHSNDLGFLSKGERASVEIICNGSESQALTAAMKLATEGAGTDDDAVKAIVARTSDSRDEQESIDALLSSGREKDGTALSPARRAELEGRRSQLGDVVALARPVRDRRGEIDRGTFLGMLQDDVKEAELLRYAPQVGVSDYEQAKQRILDAIGTNYRGDLKVDWDAIYAALDGLHAHLTEEQLTLQGPELTAAQTLADRDLRLSLMTDAAIEPRLRFSIPGELAQHVAGDPYAAAERELKEAYQGAYIDEERIFRVICGLTEDVRKNFPEMKPDIYAKLTRPATYGDLLSMKYMTDEEVKLVKVAFETGHIPTADAIKLAVAGAGTKDALIEQTFAAMPAEERAMYRLGYYLLAGHELKPKDQADADRQARARQACTTLYDQLAGGLIAELDEKDRHKALEQLLGEPTLQELATEGGRSIAAQIWYDQIRGQLGVGWWPADYYGDTGAVQAGAGWRFVSTYADAVADGALTLEEFAVLSKLAEQFHERSAEHTAAVDEVIELAGEVAVIVVGIVLTFASDGALGPVAEAMMESYGVAITGLAEGAAKVAGSELVGGEHYHALSAQGGADFLKAAIEGLAGKLGEKFPAYLGLETKALNRELSRHIVETSNTAVGQAGKAWLASIGKAGVEGVVGGSIGEVLLTAMDAETWKRGLLEAFQALGAAIIRGGVQGGLTNAVVAGPFEFLKTYIDVTRLKKLAVALERHGVTPGRLYILSVEDLHKLAHVLDLAGSDPKGARKLLLELGEHAADAGIERLWDAIFETTQPEEQRESSRDSKHATLR
jgi:hypothetical protein